MQTLAQPLIIITARNAAETASAPTEILLFRAGEIEIEHVGRAVVDQKAYDMVAAAFARRGNDIVIDYEHQTLAGGKAPAAGWITGLSWDPERGIIARVNWTDEAERYLLSSEYRYFSPVFYVRKSDRRIAFLHSVALTNAPKTNHLQPLLAKLGAQTKEPQMNLLKELIAKLELADTATEKDVVAAVAALQNQTPAEKIREVVAKDILAALDMDDGDASAVVASIHALRQKEKGMVSRAEFEKLQADLAAREAAEIVAKALSDGKITPDQQDWAAKYAARDPQGFETFIAKAPVVIPKDKLPGGKSQPSADVIEDEAVLKVAKLFGNSPEDLKKYASA